VNKVDFLTYCREAREEAITPANIKSTWKKTGLFPFDPQVVIQELPSVELAQAKSTPQSSNLDTSQPLS
jgi:hypothetical protein